jgi:hypothetical protein
LWRISMLSNIPVLNEKRGVTMIVTPR